ncbi:hypothetical protein, partial [Marinobacter sp. ELB17]|uniref:hypothetical protein n=1 Tax=Marinobacter sp. ELB17 TaxID=270374 RepID=UPI0000F3AAF2
GTYYHLRQLDTFMISIVLNRLSTEKGLRNNSSIQSLKRIIKEQLLQLAKRVSRFFARTKHQLKKVINQAH